MTFPDLTNDAAFEAEEFLQTLVDHLQFHTSTDTKEDKRSSESDVCPYGFKTCLLRAMTNLIGGERRTRVQDVLGKLGAVQLCMSSCHIEKNNPMMKEWALFGIRNLTANHTDNQQVIQAMSLNEVANSEELDRMGLDIRKDPVTGKLSVSQKSKHSP